MKMILRYTDCMQDRKIVFGLLAKNNIKILKTKRGYSIYPNIFINVKSIEELNKVLYEINKQTSYEVSIVKMKK